MYQRGNSTIATGCDLSPATLRTMTPIWTQREFAVICFDLTIPVGWMVSPGRTGLTRRADAQSLAARRRGARSHGKTHLRPPQSAGGRASDGWLDCRPCEGFLEPGYFPDYSGNFSRWIVGLEAE
jgi:hypothetical protein